MASFPKGWFFIKNLNNGYVLSTEKQAVGEPVIIASIKSRDFDSQLWQHGEDGRLHNKQTGFVLDIFKGFVKVGSEIVQQNDSDSSEGQTFGASSEGHIFLVKNPKLVLGIKESFFTRREGQHIHLQEVEKNLKENKEQRWDFILPSQKRFSAITNPMDSLKRTISGASLGSFSNSSIHTQHDEDGCLDESHSNNLTSFPDTEFFIKSDSTGYFIGIEANAINSPGGHLSLEPLRKNNYESQLWHYDVISGRLINKNSGFTLSVEELSDESSVFQSSSTTEKDLAYQSWSLTTSGEIKLKNDQKWVLGFKKDSWFGLNREGVSVLLQKQTDNKTHSNQRFIIVMPVFKKKTTEIVTVSEQQGVFPEGYFFIKNQKHGLVITVLETDKLAAQAIACQLDIENYNRQLWKFKEGFLINKASGLVLDIRGGCIVSGAEICQYKQKNEGNQNQQWGLSVEGYIHAKTHTDVVLAISGNKKNQYSVYLSKKKTPDHEEQRWNFVLPVFKQKSTTVAHTTVQKSVSYHHYAQYPSGWFFIRSFTNGSSTEAPLVLTADNTSHHVSLLKISKEEWRNQLWMYWNGVLINFATQLAIDVDSVNVGSTICQELRKAGSVSQRWNLTIEGYLVHGSNPSLTLVPSLISENKYKLALTDHISAEQGHRWGILSPEIKVENNTQLLVRWSITFLTEWKKFSEQHVQKVTHRIANWPEDTFFITAQDGLALAPEKSEAFSFLVVKKLEYAQSEHFKWIYRNGFVVHVATGLVLHASDDLVGGSQLQIREELRSDSKTIDQRQKWVIKTDGSIISELKANLGFALIQQGNLYLVQLAYASNTSEHYNWGFLHGHYESRYSEVYKKEVNVVTHTERILLTVRNQRTYANANTKLVSHSFGVFPENWFYIRSKEDKSLVLTAPSRKEGAKLTLSMLDYKVFRRQLWHVQDDGCLVNLESDLVIDVAGGAFNIGSDIIQWHEKYLRRHRKNQVWALSVDGHLHPKARPGLVIGVKGNKAVDGAEIQLHHRGSLDLGYQLWTFATPIFGRTISGVTGISAAGVLEQNDDSVFIESVDEAEFRTSASDRYERTSKLTVIRRWGLFPEGGFFIRSNFGDEHLTLTVEKKPRTGENGCTEYEVALRPINFQEYQWHFWAYHEGHLINAQTGLALDATPTKGVLVEDGLRNPLFVRDKSMTENQFWSLTADGEIFLRSDERLVIGVSNSRRVSVPGAQVGLRQLRVRTYMNDQNQQETSLKSEKWLKWLFSKPVYRSKTTSAISSTSINVIEESSNEIVEDIADQELNVKQKEESADDYSVEDDDSYSSDDEDDEDDSDKNLNLIGNLGIATAGAGILAGSGMISNVITSAPETISTAIIGKKDKLTQTIIKKTSYNSLKYDRKDSFHVKSDYVPTGFEKIIRYVTYQQPNFPTAGYFMIKSYLHGLVFDVVDGETKDGAYVVLSPIKSKDFASQLWFFKDGRVVNLKGHNLVLDASMTDTITAGERLVISTKKSSLGLSDQYWEYSNEGGLICLNSKRNLVLGVKELKRVTDQSATVDVYIQEEKSHLTTVFGRPEQRWEIKIPAFIPVEQTTNTTAESKYTIIQGGKIYAISSSLSAIIAFDGLKETFHHKITAKNQWPNSQNWFFIRVGNENAFLSSGSTDSSEVKLVSLGQKEDYKQFLWVYVNGYLVNYKYMLRLAYNKKSNKLVLSSSTNTLDQVFSISSKGNLSVKLQSETTYFSISSSYGSYELKTSCTEVESCDGGHSLQLHVPKFSNVEVEKGSKIALSTVISWIQSSQVTTTTVTTTTVTTVTKLYGVFPVGTWFFIKADTRGGDSLVLAVRDASSKSGASLVLKKLSFKDYRSQLWTFRDGLLINYGSQLVIDVNGEINESSKLIQSAENGTSSQKWSLTSTGRIHLDSYAQYSFGYTLAENMCEDLEVVLVTTKEAYEASSKTQAINWRFSVPVFSKIPIASTGSNNSSKTIETSVKTSISTIERLTDCIEKGALIEAVEEADIKVEDICVKKNNSINNAALPSISVVEKEKQHGFQNILTNVGIAVTAGVVAVGAVGGAVKIADKISEHKEANNNNTSNSSSAVKTQEHKQQSSSASKVNQGAVTDVNKTTETVIVRRSQRTSIQLIEESRVIVHAWRIVFSQRVHHCKTKAELIQTIEESREELFRRLDEHLRVYASVEHLIAGAVPEWHVSILQVKELYRARVFEKFLDDLKSAEVIGLTDINFDSTLATAAEEVEKHYQLVITTQNKVLSEASTSSATVTASKCSEEVFVYENILVTIATIKVTVRYWLIGLYETISIAKSNGSSDEEIKTLIENSQKELSKEFTKIKKTTTTHIQKSSSTILNAKQTSICNTIATAIAQTESVISNQIRTVCSEKQYLDSEDHWLDVTCITEECLSDKLQVYQTAITQEITEVQKNEISTTDKVEIAVVLDEKMVVVAQQTVANKLVETQTKMSSSFIEITQQISWLLEESKASNSSQKAVKQDILAIVDAAQIEINSRIAETKLVIRAYYAHLTYLSWAERRRIEYSLDNINASITASIAHFKQSIEKNEVHKEGIIRYSNYSFSASFSRIVLTDLQRIIVKVTNIKETSTVVNKAEEVKAEKAKIAIIGESSSTTNNVTEIKKTTTDKIELGKSKKDETSKKTEAPDIEEAKKIVKVNAGKQTKISDNVESEVEQTKIGKVDNNKQSTSADVTETNHQSSSSDKPTAAIVSTAVLSAAAAAMASAAISHQKEGKETTEQQEGSSTDTSKVQKPIQTSVTAGKTSEVNYDDKQNNSTTPIAKQEKSETLVVVYNQVQILIRDWMIALNKRVYEYATKKSNNAQQEIDTIVFDFQLQLIVEIEKIKRNNNGVIGASQNSLHNTLSWIRSTVWKQVFEVKRIGYEIATSSETSNSHYKEKLESLTNITAQEIDVVIEKLKTSPSVIHVVGNESSGIIAAGKTFEGVDYSKTSYGESIEKTKVTVSILIEDTRVSVQQIISKLTASIVKRRKQGGENVQADIDIIIKKHRDEINSYILKSKTEFGKRITSVHQSSSSIKVSKIDVELTNETIKKVQATLDQVQESVLVQVTKVEQITSSMTVTSEVGYEENLASVSYEACKTLYATLTLSEIIIGHHIEVTAESSALHQSISTVETEGSSSKNSSKASISLGVEYGLIVIAETTKNTSSQISELAERIHYRITIGSKNLETDIKGLIAVSNKELDLIFEQAKIKISYELSMVASHEKVDEKHFLTTLEAIRSSAKKRITQIQTAATSQREDSKVVSEKLLQIVEESRLEITKYYESIKQTVTEETEKVSESVHGVIASETTSPSQDVTHHTEEQKKQKEHKASVDLAKKVLIGSAAVAAGTAIAVHVSKKLKEQKEKNEKVEQTKKQTTIVIEDVKAEFNKWISSLTETVTSQSNQPNVSTEDIILTIEKSKTEFVEIIKKAKSNKVLAGKHQHQILSWIEQTAISQATRIEKIAVSSSSSAAVNVESRLEIIKISTTQEIEAALEKCKHSRPDSIEYVGVTAEQLKLKEAALLDIRSELVIVIQDVRSSLVTYFQKFTRSVIARIEQGGKNAEKDVVLLIANSRKELSVYIESIKSTATKRLSALETKSSTSIISIAALSGIATAEIINVVKSCEEILLQKVNHVHSSIWYMETNQDTSKIVQAITAIESETTIDITEKVESSKYGFVTAINDHHKAGHICTEVSEHTQTSENAIVVLQTSLSVQEIKVTVREWFRTLAEAVSICSQKGGSTEEIDLIIKNQNAIIVEYLDQSVTNISETIKTEEEIKYLHTTVEQVKTIIVKTSTEIKVIGVEHSSYTSYGYGGFDKMTSVITQHEHEVSEALVSYESKISKKLTEEKKQKESSKVDKKPTTVLPKNTYTVVTVEYIISTVHTWLQELMVEVSERAKHEHNITIITKEINAVMANYKEYISIEFEMISKGIRTSKAATTTKQELIDILEWTRGMILQTSNQIQSIGINCAVSFSATGGIEQMKPLVNATENQISVAVGRCNKTIKINVEHNSVHYEKKKAKSECAKQETKKKAECIAAEKKKKESECAKKDKKSKNPSVDSSSDSGTNSDSESDDDKKPKEDCKKIGKIKKDNDKVKKSKKSEVKKNSTKKNNSDDSSGESDSDKKTSSVDKKKIAAGIIAGTIIKSKIDHFGSSDSDLTDASDTNSDTDTDSNKNKTSVIDKKKLSSGHSTLDVTIIVNEWYKKLIVDVSTRAKKGGSSVTEDIEIIVQKATKRITETLRIISMNAHKSLLDATTVKQYQASIEWTKNLIIQSSHQIKAIGFNSAASSSKTGGIEQMRPIAISIQQQINIEIRRYKLTAEKTETVGKKTEKIEKIETVIDVVEHKKNNDKICNGRKSAVNRKEYCKKLEQHVNEVVAESKVVIVSWFAQLVRDISICIHQGGSDIDQETTAIIEKSKYELDSTIRRTQNKLSSSIEVYQEDKTFAMIQYQVEQSLKAVKTTVDSKIVEIQEISTKRLSQTEFTEKLHVVLEKSKASITNILESGYKESVNVIKHETTQTESTVTIIDTVDTVKTTVAHLYTKLTEDIHSISVDTSINNKEERINILIEQVNTEIQHVITEAKTKVSYECHIVKKISKTKEQELLNTIDYVHKTFTSDTKKIQQISIEAIKKSNTNMKENISSVVKSSHEKIDSVLTKTTAAVVGAATAAIAIHTINKKNKQEEKKSQKNKLSVDAEENAFVLSQWFELFTLKISGFVQKSEGDVVQNVTNATEQAEQEISEIITTSRNDFFKRLTLQNLDQESFDYACKHYEESLELVRVTIISEIVEVKKIAIHAHTSGSVQEIDTQLIKLTKKSNERIKIAMGSSVTITEKVQQGTSNKSEPILQIEVQDDDAIVVGEEAIDYDRKEETTITAHQEKTKIDKAKEKKKTNDVEKIVAGSLAIGAAAAGAAIIKHKNDEKTEAAEKQKQQDTITAHQKLKYDSGIAAIDNVNISISTWFTSLVQKVSAASKSGNSSNKITMIVENSRAELTQIIEHAKTEGSKFCASANDEHQFISKIDWAASVAHNQAVQIQQIGINAASGKTDMTSQMQAIATASYHQIEITLQQMKTTVRFHQKINKINSNKTQVDNTSTENSVSEKPLCGKMDNTIEKTKIVYSVIQETRVTTISIFVSLSQRIVIRIRQGGPNVQEDINKMISTSEKEITKVFNEAKVNSTNIDKKIQLEIEHALAIVRKTVQEQMTELKNVTNEAISTSSADSKVTVEKVLDVSKNSMSKIEMTYTSMSQTILTSLTVVTQTAQEVTESVQGWFVDLTSKISKLLEASDCSEEETQSKIDTIVADAEIEINTKIEKFQQASVAAISKKSSKTTQVTTDHHLEIFFGNIKSSVQTQLDVLKTAVKDSNKTDKSKIMSTLELTETKLQQEIKTHYEAVENITTVQHITGKSEQKIADEVEKNRLDSYKSTIEKTAAGAATVAAAAAVAIGYHKKNQPSQTTTVQVVKESSIKDVQFKIDTWFVKLTEKVTTCTKKGGSNVSVEVAKIVQEAQSELEVTINEAKSQYVSTQIATYSSAESHRTFIATLEWIKTTVYSQSSQITQIVNQGSSSVDLTSQIENHVCATKHQIDSALEVHYKNETSTTVAVDQSKKSQSGSTNKQTVQNIVEIVKETRKQTQDRFKLETTVIVQESKTEITNWLVLLLESITDIIHGNSETIRKDIFAKIEVASKEIDVFIKQTKEKFMTTGKTTATSHVEAQTQTLVVNSVKQTLDCIDSIRATLILQISIIRETVTRIDVEDIDIITKRLEAIITRTQKRVHHTLEVDIDLAISAAFEGKAVTWSETCVIPTAFTNVRTIAFDVLGTIANYRKTLEEVWKKIVTPKNDVVLSALEFNTFVEDWYGAYTEIKRQNFIQKRPVSDDISLHEALVHILRRYYIKELLTESEIEELCDAWRNVGIYDDVTIGIRRLKNQVSAKYATVAVSDTLSTRSMVQLAQNNCLCWHAQFTAEMFSTQTSSTVSASRSVIRGTIQLLGLERANQLAIVTSSAQMAATAKQQGCFAILVERDEQCNRQTAHNEAAATNQFDLKVDGIDIFGESVLSFLEHESMVQVWNKKSAPAAPRIWVQQLKGPTAQTKYKMV